MSGYALAPIVLEFPELGPDVSVTIIHPLLLPNGAGASAVLQAAAGDLRIAAGEQPTIPIGLAAEIQRRQVAALVKDWHGVCDPYTGEDLPLPRTDPAVVDRCPAVIVNRIAAEIAAHSPDVPKAKPEQS